ncbi:MAG: bifunctional diguanylate cyclase/phosphodiesterase [Pseudomonadota bacterium]
MTKIYLLKAVGISALFAACIAVLLLLGPKTVSYAERIDAQRMAYDLIDAVGRDSDLPGNPVAASQSWSMALVGHLTHTHTHNDATNSLDLLNSHHSQHFGSFHGYAVFDPFGNKTAKGGKGLLGGAVHITLTGGLETVLLNAQYQLRTLETAAGKRVYRSFIPLTDGAGVTAVAVVDIVATGIETLVSESVQTASIAAAIFVGLIFAAVVMVLLYWIRKMQLAESRASYLANFDPLTKLRNRRSLETELKIFSENDTVCLFIADIDDFKQINDTYGHLAGDKVIKHVSQALRTSIQTPLLARWAGDEFVGICRSNATDQEQAAEFVRLQEAVNTPIELAGKEVSCTISIGSTRETWSDGAFERLLHQADMALYAAKAIDSKGNHVAHTAALDAERARERKIAERLQVAIEKQSFSLAFQPQYDAMAKRLRGFEVLVRWEDTQLGQISPAIFIPIAERSEQILRIGEWVLAEACKRAAAWPIDCQVSVNVSAHQISQPDFVDQVRQALQAAHLAPNRLELELTETAVLDHNRAVFDRLNEVAQMGVGLALDDFGTGHSTLSYLTSLPITKLKIDRSFVNQAGDNGPNDAVIKAVVGLAKSLRMSVIAEGVETTEQSDRITQMGCANIQGYLYGRPTLDPFASNSPVHRLITNLEEAFIRKRA